MRKFIIALLLIPFACMAQIKVPKEVFCDETKKIVNALLSSEYKESPQWLGQDETSKYVLFANEKTGSWTIIQFNEQIACILGVGDGHKLVNKGKML